MEEDQQLQRGVHAFGTDWRKIRAIYNFGVRTEDQLRNRWRTLEGHRQIHATATAPERQARPS